MAAYINRCMEATEQAQQAETAEGGTQKGRPHADDTLRRCAMSSGGAHEAELLSVPLAWIGAMLVKRYPSCADIDDCFVIQCRAHLTSLSLPVVKCPGPLSLSSEVWTSVLASPSLTGTRYQTIVAARVAHKCLHSCDSIIDILDCTV